MTVWALMVFVYNMQGGITSQVFHFKTYEQCAKIHSQVVSRMSSLGCFEVIK